MWDLLICCHCKRLLDNPRILSCTHSLSEKCLTEITKEQESPTCPKCRAIIRSATNNTLLSRVLHVIKREMNPCNEDSACEGCSVQGLLRLRCIGCDVLMCTRCLYTHHEDVTRREEDCKQNDDERTQHKRNDKLNRCEISKLKEGETIEELSANEICQHKNKNAFEKHERNKYVSSRENHQIHVVLKCKEHRSEELRFFCSSCSQLVCQECVIVDHLYHIFLSTSDVAPRCRGQLRTLLNQTVIRILYLSHAIRETRDIEEKLGIYVRGITDDILGLRNKEHIVNGESSKSSNGLGIAFHERMHGIPRQEYNVSEIFEHVNILDRHSNNEAHQNQDENISRNEPQENCVKNGSRNELLLKDLMKISRQKLDTLAKHRKKLETRLALFHNSQSFTTKLIFEATDVEVLILVGCVLECLGELCENTPELPIECPDDAFITINRSFDQQPGACGDLNHCGSKDGKITTGEGCASNCFATGDGLTDAAVGEDCTFTVIVKNDKNIACREGENSIVARVKTPNGGYFRAQLLEYKHGRHKFRYRSYSAGPHVLRITLRDEEILGSPFETMCNGSTDYSRRGRLVTKFGRLGSGPGELREPQGLAVDRLSRIIVADTGNHRIQVFDENGRFLLMFGRQGNGAGEFNEPYDVTVARNGHVIVADCLNSRLQFFTPDGLYVREMRCHDELHPIAVTADQYDNIVVVDDKHSRVFVGSMSDDSQRILSRASSESARRGKIHDVACNQTGETFLISRVSSQNSGLSKETPVEASLVQVLDNNGAFIREFVTPSYTRTQSSLCSLVTDYDDRVLVTGSGNKVQVFTRLGGHLTNITFTEKEASEINISAIALSPNESVIVADSLNGRILVF